MKVDVSYVLNGNFVAKTVALRSLDRVIANAEQAGAVALSVSKPTPSMKKKAIRAGNFIYRAMAYSEKYER